MPDCRYDHVHLRSPDPDATAPFHGPQRKRASHCSRDDGRRVASPGLGVTRLLRSLNTICKLRSVAVVLVANIQSVTDFGRGDRRLMDSLQR
jgi:hypothetical protein